MDPLSIRNILNKLQNINEQVLTEASRGLLYRAIGDTFIQGDPKNPTATMSFAAQEYYPEVSAGGAYPDYATMENAAKKVQASHPGIIFINKPQASTRAFAVITFNGPNPGVQTFICKFFVSITPDMTGKWKNNEVPPGWKLNKKTSLKAGYGLKPADLLEEGPTFTPGQLVTALTAVEKVSPLMEGMHQLMGGTLPTFAGQKDMLSAIQDDFGEILAPIALAKGLVNDSGAAAAQKTLLGGASWDALTINFPSAKNNGLVDSYVYVNGVEIGISSKGKSGAKASIKNVLDGVKLARSEGTPEQKKKLKTYAIEVALIETLGTESAVDFPLNYAVTNGLLDQPSAAHIRKLIKSGAKSISGIPESDKPALKELLIRFNADTTLSNYCVGYHALAVVARDVSASINENKNFGAACLYFININPIIQIYLTAAVTGDDVKITKLTSMYPPNFEGTILIDPGKNYSGTGAGGRLCVNYESDEAAAAKLIKAQKSSAKRQAAVNSKIVNVARGGQLTDLRPTGTPDTGSISRQKEPTEEPIRGKKVSPKK